MADIVIKDWQRGIGPSPHLGFANICNMNIWDHPGIAKIGLSTVKKTSTTVTARPNWIVRNPITIAQIYALDANGQIYKSADSGLSWAVLAGNTFTVTSASPAVFTSTAHGLVEHDTIVLSTTGALYTGLVAGTTYYVIAAGLTADNFELSLSDGGAAVNTSGSQSGTHSFRITTSMHGNGLAIWKDYLFVARDTKLDVYGPLTTSPTWTNNWKTIDSDTLWHMMIVSKSDFKLYGGAGRYVFSLDEDTAPFAPATAASFTWTQQHLDLPTNYRIKCLEELGNNLMIGTWMGTNVFDIKIADIFPWDRSSPSFDLPLQVSENGVSAMKNINNTLYIFAGLAGHIFATNGVSIVPAGQIPAYIVDAEVGGYYEFYPGAVANHKGRLYFGVGYGTGGMGVYSLNGNTLSYEHLISTGNVGNGGTSIVQISALLSIGYANLLIGWKDDTAYGIDSLAYRYTGYTAFIESPFYPVGTSLGKRKFNEVEFQLVKALTTGQGVKIKYRNDLSGSWVTLGTYDYATWGGIMSKRFAPDSLECEFIQIRIEMTTGTDSSTTPELKSVTLR